MRVYLPFKDGSSISFDGESFIVHKRPNDIDAIDSPEFYKPCEAESAWNFKWEKVVNALQNAWKKKSDAKKLSRSKKIYRP